MNSAGFRMDCRLGDGQIKQVGQRDSFIEVNWEVDRGPEGDDKSGEFVAKGAQERIAGPHIYARASNELAKDGITE
jgi:hypothetical protein